MYQQQRQQVGVLYDAVHRKLRQVINPFQSSDFGKGSPTSETGETKSRNIKKKYLLDSEWFKRII